MKKEFWHVSKWFTLYSHLQGVYSTLSPFQGSMEAEENSPSASTPASPQTKTASEGELSTTAAELLQDYMTTVWRFHPLSLSLSDFEKQTFFPSCINSHFDFSTFSSPSSCGQSFHHRRSSSLLPCSTNTETVPPFMSSVLTCDNCMGTAGSSFYLVRPL